MTIDAECCWKPIPRPLHHLKSHSHAYQRDLGNYCQVCVYLPQIARWDNGNNRDHTKRILLYSACSVPDVLQCVRCMDSVRVDRASEDRRGRASSLSVCSVRVGGLCCIWWCTGAPYQPSMWSSGVPGLSTRDGSAKAKLPFSYN